jgi:hypothetical protein
MQSANDWKNIEFGGHAMITDEADDEAVLYVRGANHTGDGWEEGCLGSAYKCDIDMGSGDIRYAKESWHVQYDFTSFHSGVQNPGSWFGWKFIVYNSQDGKSVIMETWIDQTAGQNNWQDLFRHTDSGDWSSSGGECHLDDESSPILWGGPLVVFRNDSGAWGFRNFTCREIDAFGSGGGDPGSGGGTGGGSGGTGNIPPDYYWPTPSPACGAAQYQNYHIFVSSPGPAAPIGGTTPTPVSLPEGGDEYQSNIEECTYRWDYIAQKWKATNEAGCAGAPTPLNPSAAAASAGSVPLFIAVVRGSPLYQGFTSVENAQDYLEFLQSCQLPGSGSGSGGGTGGTGGSEGSGPQGYQVMTITASGDDGNVPSNVNDKNVSTRWSDFGIGQWIALGLGSTKRVDQIKIAWYKGDERKRKFIMSYSADGTTYTDAITAESTGTTTSLETYNFAEVDASYIKFTHNNDNEMWFSITEIELHGPAVQGNDPTDPEEPPPPPELMYNEFKTIFGIDFSEMQTCSGI